MTTYPTPEPIRIDARIPAGRIQIETMDAAETNVEVRRMNGGGEESPKEVRQILRTRRDGRQVLYIAIEQGRRRWSGRDSYEVIVSTPHGAEVGATTGSANVSGKGRFDSVDVKTGSGDISFQDLSGDARIKSASGDVGLGEVGGSASVASASGKTRIRKVGGELNVSLVSGDLLVDAVGGDVKARTVSGDAAIGSIHRGAVSVTTVSGETQLTVLPGRRVWMDLVSASGDTSSEFDISGEAAAAGGRADVEIHARSVSGDIRVRRPKEHEAGAA